MENKENTEVKQTQDFTHVLVSKELGEKLLAYLGTHPAAEVLALMNGLGAAPGVTVTNNTKTNEQPQSQDQTASS